jgi:hypothetical protein
MYSFSLGNLHVSVEFGSTPYSYRIESETNGSTYMYTPAIIGWNVKTILLKAKTKFNVSEAINVYKTGKFDLFNTFSFLLLLF